MGILNIFQIQKKKSVKEKSISSYLLRHLHKKARSRGFQLHLRQACGSFSQAIGGTDRAFHIHNIRRVGHTQEQNLHLFFTNIFFWCNNYDKRQHVPDKVGLLGKTLAEYNLSFIGVRGSYLFL